MFYYKKEGFNMGFSLKSSIGNKGYSVNKPILSFPMEHMETYYIIICYIYILYVCTLCTFVHK